MLKQFVGKTGGESKPEAYPRGYVEDFDEPRTKLADCFSIRLESLSIRAHSRYDVAMSVIMTRDQLVPLLRQAQTQGKRIVFTNGCFDLMHVGHTRYLRAAKDLGDLLIVAINSDKSVRSLNKAPDRPIVPEAQRAEVVAALGSVDYVILFDEPDPHSLIAALQPDVLVKGGDWAVDQIVGREIVKARGGTVRAIPLVPGVSTTSLIERIRSTRT
jgi:D-glycero-beta-D-manno-heptose 1-phosphate adenylyltransferase